MSAQLELLDAVIDDLNGGDNAPVLFAKINIGQAPKEGGISAEIAAGNTEMDYLDRSSLGRLAVLFLAKAKDQQKAANALFNICNYLQAKTVYPRDKAGQWHVTTIRTTTAPNFVEKEQSGGFYLYAAVVSIEYYLGLE